MNAILVEGTQGKNRLEDLDINGRMVLISRLNKVWRCGVYAPGTTCSRYAAHISVLLLPYWRHQQLLILIWSINSRKHRPSLKGNSSSNN